MLIRRLGPIGVKVLSIALVRGRGGAVTVWSAPAAAPYVNLEQLTSGRAPRNVSVPVGRNRSSAHHRCQSGDLC